MLIRDNSSKTRDRYFVHYAQKIHVSQTQVFLNSVIPVTILRYMNGITDWNYPVGEEPVNAGEVYLQLTSKCTQYETLLNLLCLGDLLWMLLVGIIYTRRLQVLATKSRFGLQVHHFLRTHR